MCKQKKCVSSESFLFDDQLSFSYFGVMFAGWVGSLLICILWLCSSNKSDSAAYLLIPLGVAAGVTMVCLALLRRRYEWISDVLARGIRVNGIIRSVSFNRHAGNVVFRYAYEGVTYESFQLVSKGLPARNYLIGQEVTVVVHPEDPSGGYIEGLLIDSSDGSKDLAD